MANFDDMFDRVSGESARRKQEREEQERRERAERDAQFESDRQALLAKVEGLLDDAKQRFEAKGVPVIISNNWSDIGRPMFPEIEFRCEKDYQPNSIGGKYKPQGRSAFFSVRNGTFEVGLNQSPGQRVRHEKLSGSDDELIQRAIEEALNTYFQSVEEGERPR